MTFVSDAYLYRECYKRPGKLLYRVKIRVCLLLKRRKSKYEVDKVRLAVSIPDALLKMSGYHDHPVATFFVGAGWKQWFYTVEYV